MTSPIIFRPFKTEDTDQVLDLMRITLGETGALRRTNDLFNWKHIENPFGKSIMLLAMSRDEVVGFRAFMRWELTTPSGTVVKCARPVDTATRPSFQRQGIFRELTLLAVEIAKSEGVDLIFNTPNAKSGAGYRSMGWTEVGKIRVQARPSLRLLAGAGESHFSANGRVERIGQLSSMRFPARKPQGLRTPRRPEYMEWRFELHPSAGYLAVGDDRGVAVLRPNIRKGKRELVISDLYGPDPDTALSMVRGLSQRASYLIASFSDGSPEREAVLRSGLFPVPWVSALDLHAYPLRDVPVDPTNLSNWDIALSDLELL